jgi:glutamate synthase domain-containing protein 2
MDRLGSYIILILIMLIKGNWMKDDQSKNIPRTDPVQSATFSSAINSEIRRAAATGIYDIRGGGAKRKVPHFDDLLFLGASISRYPLEGYREKCETKVLLGTRFAKNPMELDILLKRL